MTHFLKTTSLEKNLSGKLGDMRQLLILSIELCKYQYVQSEK